GPSGAGKSTLSYACARAGWTFVSDDCVFLRIDSPTRHVLGRHLQMRFRVDAPALFPELKDHIARERPNGKVSIEIPLSTSPKIRTAERVSAGAMIFLERRAGAGHRAERVAPEEAVGRILSNSPCYIDAVNALHERTVRRFAEVPAFRLEYESLDDA